MSNIINIEDLEAAIRTAVDKEPTISLDDQLDLDFDCELVAAAVGNEVRRKFVHNVYDLIDEARAMEDSNEDT